MADHVDDDPVTVVVRVQRMEHVARIDLDPGGVRRGSGPREQPEPRRVAIVPPVGQRDAFHGPVEVEDHGEIEHDHVRVGQTHVVHHDRTAHVDRLAAHERAGRVDHVVPAERLDEAVGQHVQVAVGVELRVGVDAGRQRAAEVPAPDRLELGRDLIGQAQLVDGPDATGVVDHVGVARSGEQAALGRRRHLFEPVGRRHLRRAHPSIAVPARRRRRGGRRRAPCRRPRTSAG